MVFRGHAWDLFKILKLQCKNVYFDDNFFQCFEKNHWMYLQTILAIHDWFICESPQVSVEYQPQYLDLNTNSKLAEIYQHHGESVGIKFSTDERLATLFGSTDMGNLSYKVPSIHPLYDINTDLPNHSRGFTEATGKQRTYKRECGIPEVSCVMLCLATILDLYKRLSMWCHWGIQCNDKTVSTSRQMVWLI